MDHTSSQLLPLKIRNYQNEDVPLKQRERSATYLASKHQRQSVSGTGNFAMAQQWGALWALYYWRHSWGKKAWLDGRCRKMKSCRCNKTESYKEDSRLVRESFCIRVFAHAQTHSHTLFPPCPPFTTTTTNQPPNSLSPSPLLLFSSFSFHLILLTLLLLFVLDILIISNIICNITFSSWSIYTC